jgi:hypothetical protein
LKNLGASAVELFTPWSLWLVNFSFIRNRFPGKLLWGQRAAFNLETRSDASVGEVDATFRLKREIGRDPRTMREKMAIGCLMMACLGCSMKESKTGEKAAGNTNGPPGVELEQKGDALYRKGNESFSLEYYKGKNPVIVAKAPKDSPAYQQFTQDLQTHQQALQKHGVVVVELYDIQNATFSGQIRGLRALNTAEASDLHDMYGAGPGTRQIFLIGKDGKILLQEKNSLDVAKAVQLLEMAQ